ncbi:MAG: hypothetical protein JSU92_00665 [Deltaproteobacteria bacterium]|nr:MAG: hypothetical protein JSU92_00665 [Deltaproteobacteria bacterium]
MKIGISFGRIMIKLSVFALAGVLAFGAGLGCGEDETEVLEAPWPEWAFHHWVWEDESTQESATALVDGYLERDIQVGAIIIDSPWETGYNTFEFDPDLYPDPQGMIDYFHSKGVRVFLWITSTINIDTELYSYAREMGYFMRKDEVTEAVVEWWKGDGGLIDFFNPEALTWWHGLVDKALALGIDGWKCDGTDYHALLGDALYSPGLGRRVERIEYSHAYYRDFFDYTREKLGEDRIITARPVDNYGTGLGGEDVSFAPREINWAGWVGDQDATFAGLKAALNNMLESSKLGYIAFGSDIGGYREEDSIPPEGRTKELFIRWAQLGAFSPVMENGGGGEHRPWMFDTETTDIYRKFTEIHYALIPYLMEEGAKAFGKGNSLMTFIEDNEDRYLLGPDILVAPMLESGTSRTVKFPDDGDWVYLFDRSKVFTGGAEATLDIPLSEFPAFLRKGFSIEKELSSLDWI